jgi:FKBP-type peptidyl-prolyl cis-trans isomerase
VPIDTIIMTARIFSLVSCLLLAAACSGDNPTSPTEVTGSAPYSATDLRVGTGAEAMTGRQAVVNYTGWLYSNTATDNKGRQFDTSIGRAPFAFTPGVTNVIQGWHQGVPGMRVGGLRRLVLPPSLAYGAAGRPPDIPQNATLLFEIELLSVQ